MYLSLFFFLSRIGSSNSQKNGLDKPNNKLDQECMLISNDENDRFPLFLTALLIKYIETNNITVKIMHPIDITNVHKYLCSIFIKAMHVNDECKNERLFFETINKVYFDINSSIAKDIQVSLEAMYLKAIEFEDGFDKSNILHICHLFSRAFAAKISKSTKYKMRKYILDKCNNIYLIYFRFKDSIKNTKLIEMHIKYTKSLTEEEELCQPYIKEIKVNYIRDIIHVLLAGLAHDEIIRIESDMHLIFISNIVSMIDECKKNKIALQSEAIIFSIYHVAKCFIKKNFIDCERDRCNELASKINLQYLVRPIKYTEIGWDEELVYIARTLEELPGLERTKVAEIFDTINDILRLLKFIYLFYIFRLFHAEYPAYNEFMLSITELEVELFKQLIESFKPKTTLDGNYMDIFRSTAQYLLKIIEESSVGKSNIQFKDIINTCSSNRITNHVMNQYLTIISSQRYNLF